MHKPAKFSILVIACVFVMGTTVARAASVVWVPSDRSGDGTGLPTITLMDTANGNALSQPFIGAYDFPADRFRTIGIAHNSSYVLIANPTQPDYSLLSSFVIDTATRDVSGFAVDADGAMIVAPGDQQFYVVRKILKNGSLDWYVTRVEVDQAQNAREAGDVKITASSTHLAIASDGSRLYANGNGMLSVIDPSYQPFALSGVAATTTTGEEIALSPDDSKLYVVEHESNSITIIDTASLMAAGTIGVGVRPVNARVLNSLGKLYVINQDDPSITVIDTATDSVIRTVTLPAGEKPMDITFAPDGSRAYVLEGKFPSTGETDVVTLDTANDAIISTVSFPNSWYSYDLLAADRAYTPTGAGVLVSPVVDVSLQFENVGTSGTTTITTTTTPPVLPTGFQLFDASLYFDISTSAAWSGTTTVCARYNTGDVEDPSLLEFLHMENSVWVDRTVSNDTTNGVICADVTSFSPFAVVVPGGQSVKEVAIDIRPNGKADRINLHSRGTVPVAILSAGDFDALQADLATVRFAGAPVDGKRSGKWNVVKKDVNHDGYMDLVLRFRVGQMTLSYLDVHATMLGSLKDGQQFSGVGSIRIVNDPKDKDTE